MNARAALVAEEPVDLAPALAVGGVDRRQGVPLDARLAQVVEPAHHLVERALAALVHAVGVVQLARAVDREPDEEVVLLEERRPLLVDQRPVRLDRVRGPLAGLQVLARRARPSGGRSRRPSASARRPARRSSPRARARAPRSAAGCRSRADRRPSGTGCPDRASPSTGRSSTRSRGCRRRRSASPAGGTPSVSRTPADPITRRARGHHPMRVTRRSGPEEDQLRGGMPFAIRSTPKTRNSTAITASLCIASQPFIASSCVFACSPPTR